MMVIGAKGFAQELLQVLLEDNEKESICFYDDINTLESLKLTDYSIITDINEAKLYFANVDNRFALGLGQPKLRREIARKFEAIGGTLVSVISSYAYIGGYNVRIGVGANILPGAVISNGVDIGRAILLYYNAIITHDCIIGDYCELSPGATLLGGSKVGHGSHIGANATVLPGINIGNNVVIAAGSVVTKDVPDNVMVAGVPALIKKSLVNE